MRQFSAHIQILAALAGKEERDFARRFAGATKHALRRQCFPRGGHIQTGGLRGLRQLIGEVGTIGEIQHQPLGLAQLGSLRRGDGRRPAALHPLKRCGNLRRQFGGRRSTQRQDTAHGQLRNNLRWRRIV